MLDLLAVTAKRRSVSVVLLHAPMRNRHGQEIVTAVTNMDIHDIARSARTFGCAGYYIVTPIDEQRDLVGRILGHWSKNPGAHPDRVEALGHVRVLASFKEVRDTIGGELEVLLTSASKQEGSVSSEQMRARIFSPGPPLVIVFGTGWGVSSSFFPEVDTVLSPICGADEAYNHLSVRAAVAIVLDRLLGDR